MNRLPISCRDKVSSFDGWQDSELRRRGRGEDDVTVGPEAEQRRRRRLRHAEALPQARQRHGWRGSGTGGASPRVHDLPSSRPSRRRQLQNHFATKTAAGCHIFFEMGGSRSRIIMTLI